VVRLVAYSSYQKFLHWVLFGLVVGLYLLTYGPGLFPRGSAGREWVWWLHISFGLLLAAFVLARLAVRATHAPPEPPADTPAWEARLASVVHALLYLLLVAVPVAGVVLAWARGNTLSFFGIFAIPAPFAPDRPFARQVQDIHALLANTIIILAAFHAAAALWHHFVRRDNVLRRMLPGSAAG
jgi:cytochrome b561